MPRDNAIPLSDCVCCSLLYVAVCLIGCGAGLPLIICKKNQEQGIFISIYLTFLTTFKGKIPLFDLTKIIFATAENVSQAQLLYTWW